MDRQFRALICLSGLCLKLVGRFWIPILDSGQISNTTLNDDYEELAVAPPGAGPTVNGPADATRDNKAAPSGCSRL